MADSNQSMPIGQVMLALDQLEMKSRQAKNYFDAEKAKLVAQLKSHADAHQAEVDAVRTALAKIGAEIVPIEKEAAQFVLTAKSGFEEFCLKYWRWGMLLAFIAGCVGGVRLLH